MILGGDLKRVVTSGIPLHESELPQKLCAQKLGKISGN